MITEKERLRRIDEYRELVAYIDSKKTSERIDWLVSNLHCSRSTARIWNMRDSHRPIPDAKIKIMRGLLIK